MKLNINPFNSANPMSFKDAAIVASVIAFVTWILTFLAAWTIGQVRADPAAFCFEAIKTYAVSWAGSFITLAGLEEYVKRTGEEEAKPG